MPRGQPQHRSKRICQCHSLRCCQWHNEMVRQNSKGDHLSVPLSAKWLDDIAGLPLSSKVPSIHLPFSTNGHNCRCTRIVQNNPSFNFSLQPFWIPCTCPQAPGRILNAFSASVRIIICSFKIDAHCFSQTFSMQTR